jgi:hypothetical protein
MYIPLFIFLLYEDILANIPGLTDDNAFAYLVDTYEEVSRHQENYHGAEDVAGNDSCPGLPPGAQENPQSGKHADEAEQDHLFSG